MWFVPSIHFKYIKYPFKYSILESTDSISIFVPIAIPMC